MWPGILAASTTFVVILFGANLQTPLRPVFALWFLLVCPGMSLVRIFDVQESLLEWVLAITLSIALTGIIASVMIYTAFWSPVLGLLVLVGITIAGVIVQALLNLRIINWPVSEVSVPLGARRNLEVIKQNNQEKNPNVRQQIREEILPGVHQQINQEMLAEVQKQISQEMGADAQQQIIHEMNPDVPQSTNQEVNPEALQSLQINKDSTVVDGTGNTEPTDFANSTEKEKKQSGESAPSVAKSPRKRKNPKKRKKEE